MIPTPKASVGKRGARAGSAAQLFPLAAEQLIGAAAEPLKRLAMIADATAPDIAKARKAIREAQERIKPAAALCDIATASRLNQEVFVRLRQAPRLDLNQPGLWRARPHTELHATNDKGLMDLESEERPGGYWPVFKGESFDLWEPDRGPGTYYAWADPKVVVPHLHKKAVDGTRRANSVFGEFEFKQLSKPEMLPCYAARIAFRDVTRATDSRSVRVALVPPKVFIANQAPYLLWPRGTKQDEAYLLGVLSSLPLDWYARRFVETHVNFYVFNPFPAPRPPEDDPLRRRVVAVAGRLAAVDARYEDWAKAVGVECGPLAGGADEKFGHICELDAVVAHLYGLEEKHLAHIFETFHEGWGPGRTATHPTTLGEYDRRLETTLGHFQRRRVGRP